MPHRPTVDPLISTGLVSRREALASGMTPALLRARLRRGEWVTVRPGWFVPHEEWEALDVYAGRPRLEILAAHRSLTRPHAASHTSAAVLHDLPVLKPRRALIHVTKLEGPRTRVRAGIKHHQARCVIPVLEHVHGIPVLTPARTALDVAREDGFDAGVVAIDAVRHRGTPLHELNVLLGVMQRWPYVTTARDALAFSDPGSESVGESLMRILVDELDLGMPMETQFEIRDPTGWARCDLRVGRHVFEFDGSVKYRLLEDGGCATTSADQVLMAEKHRQDWVCGFHLGMSRVVWDDLWGLRRQRTKARLRREFDASVARFGTDVGDLAPYRVRRDAS
ncbi:MAG TPA: hypothetical protein VH228_02340 [Nocardioides sp.]|nr:hypothetical protein [Nocardioides sp.]